MVSDRRGRGGHRLAYPALSARADCHRFVAFCGTNTPFAIYERQDCNVDREYQVGFIVLLAVGGVLSWLASILTRDDDARSILVNVIVGEIGALVLGVLVNQGSLLVGITPTALLASMAGAIFALGALSFTRMRLVR